MLTRPFSDFSVREATAADLPRVSEIKVRNWADTYGTLVDAAILGPFLDVQAQEQTLARKANLPATLLLVAQDRSSSVIGFSLTFLDEDLNPCSSHSMWSASHGGTDVGSLLMRVTAERILERGYRTMRLGVVAGNVSAANFYERLGGVHVGREPAGWADGVWHEIFRWPDLETLTLPRG